MSGKEFIRNIDTNELNQAEKVVLEILEKIVGNNDIDENKTIKKAYEHMYETASKKAEDGKYCMTDDEAKKVIAEYFEITLQNNESDILSLEDLI